MNVNKMTDFMVAMAEIGLKVKKVGELVSQGHDYNSPEVLQAAIDLAKKSDDFVALLEDLDDNMDPEKTKVPGVDFAFEGLPITEFVDARIKYALGDESEEVVKQMENAAKMINHDSFCNKACCPDTCVCGKSFAPLGMQAADADDGPAPDCPFNCDETNCSCNAGTPGIFFPDKGTPLAVTKVGEVSVNYHDNGVSFTFPEPTIYEYVESVANSTAQEINAAMDAIKEALHGEKDFSEDDIKLMRFYLSNLLDYSVFEVEAMEDKQVVHEYIIRAI